MANRGIHNGSHDSGNQALWPYSTQTTNLTNPYELINFKIRVEFVEFFKLSRPILDALRFSYDIGTTVLRIFVGFDLIRLDSPL